MKLLIILFVLISLLIPVSTAADNTWTQIYFDNDPMWEAGYNHTYKQQISRVMWYMQGSVKGYPEAQFMMGYAYYMGYGTEWDEVKAEEYFKKAAEQGYEPAILMLKQGNNNG